MKPICRSVQTTCFIDRARAALSEICRRAEVVKPLPVINQISISQRYFATLMSENMNTFKVLTLWIPG